MGDAVDLAGQAAGGLEEGLEGVGLEQRQVAAGQVQAVGEVGLEFVAGEAGELVLDGDALAERFVHSHGQALAQGGQAGQQQAQAALGIS